MIHISRKKVCSLFGVICLTILLAAGSCLIPAVVKENTEKEQTEEEGGSISAVNIPEEDEKESSEEKLPDSHVIGDFPLINQMPELPTGCEITALTMVLNYYGLPADKVEMAVEYLPKLDSAGMYYGADGLLYGNDLNDYFIGSPWTEEGIVCGTGAIVSAANAFLEDCGSSMHAVDMTGTDLEELYRLVSRDVPAVVWCTIEMAERSVQAGWYTENGEYVDWGNNDHGAVLIGYTQDTVTIADPITGYVEYDRSQFESVFESRGNKCVILQE